MLADKKLQSSCQIWSWKESVWKELDQAFAFYNFCLFEYYVCH